VISKAQRVMLFGFWNRAKQELMPGRETWTKDEGNRRRHELTAQALGRDKSWNDLTNPDVDKVKAALLSIIQPDNLDAQLRQVRQENRRALWIIHKLMRELGVNDNFVNGVIEQIKDGVDPNSPDAAWQRERERSGRRRNLEELSVCELKQEMDALRSIAKRNSNSAPGREVRIYNLHPA
jgi:hypothetical protein